MESFQSADAIRTLLSELNFGLGVNSLIDDSSHIFGTLYFMDIFNGIQFCLPHLPVQAHFDFEPVRLADSVGRRIYSDMHTGISWSDTLDELSGGGMIVPVICVSDQTHLTNFSDDQHV